MIDRERQAGEYLRGAEVHLRFGRHVRADNLLREAWRVFGEGVELDNAAPDALHRFGVLARVYGVGATPDAALERVRRAIEG